MIQYGPIPGHPVGMGSAADQYRWIKKLLTLALLSAGWADGPECGQHDMPLENADYLEVLPVKCNQLFHIPSSITWKCYQLNVISCSISIIGNVKYQLFHIDYWKCYQLNEISCSIFPQVFHLVTPIHKPKCQPIPPNLRASRPWKVWRQRRILCLPTPMQRVQASLQSGYPAHAVGFSYLLGLVICWV